MANVTRNFLSKGTVRIELSEDAAEALMAALETLTATDETVNAEFEEVWDGLVDLFETDGNYGSLRFAFDADETLVYDR